MKLVADVDYMKKQGDKELERKLIEYRRRIADIKLIISIRDTLDKLDIFYFIWNNILHIFYQDKLLKLIVKKVNKHDIRKLTKGELSWLENISFCYLLCHFKDSKGKPCIYVFDYRSCRKYSKGGRIYFKDLIKSNYNNKIYQLDDGSWNIKPFLDKVLEDIKVLKR